ncbi:MAG: hypothetical protein AAFX06_18280 [Planctomycetota bacterium]
MSQSHRRETRSFATRRPFRGIGRLVACLLFATVLTISGCLPQEPPLDGPLSFKKANQTLFGMHAAHGAFYKSEHEYEGKPFTANWELANYLKKSAKVQLKPPTEQFDRVDLYMALDQILHDEDFCPWHPVCADTILDAYTQAAQAEDDDTGWGLGSCPDGPYEVEVKLKINGPEWFCEVRVQNEMDPEKLKKAQEDAEAALDQLEAMHAND